MIILDVVQGSDEWKAIRRIKVGASMCPLIMGTLSQRKNVWNQMVHGDEVYINDAMRRGSDLEPVARQWIERKLNTSFKPMCVQSKERPWQIASLDGFSAQTKQVLEIKCPGEKTIAKVRKGEIPEGYLWQIQHQLSVTGLQEGLLLVFDGESGFTITVHRDDCMIDELNKAEEAFYFNNVLTLECPAA